MLPTQWDFLQATEQQVLMSGSAGSGKSLSLCAKAIQQAQIPGNTFLLLRKWLVNLKSSTLRTLLDGEGKRPPMLPPGTYRHNRSEKLIHLYGGGDIVYAGVGDDITRIRSIPCGAVGVDECTELSEDEWDELRIRPRIAVGSGQIYGVCNPADTAHFLYRRFISPERHPDSRVIFGLSKDNIHLPAHAQKALSQLTGAVGERMREGRWLGFDRLIYGNLPAGCFTGQMADEIQIKEWYISIDYGFTNPTALLLAGMDGDDRLWVYKEHEASKMLQSDIIAWLEQWRDKSPTIVVDPSAAGLIAEIQSRGFTCVKADNDVQIGIDRTRDVMAAGRIRFSATCVNLRRSLTNYVRKPDGKPDKIDDHCCDSLRYLIQTAVGSKILSILEDMARPVSSFGFEPEAGALISPFNHLGNDLPSQDSMTDILKRMAF
jgi:phage terminase large subunit